MSNNYYNFPVPFVPGTKVRSEQVNTQYQGLESAFDLLPTDPVASIIGTAWFGTDAQGATVNDYLITTPDPQTALANGQRVSFFATHTNAGASTINADGLGVVNFVENDGVAFGGGEIVSGRYYEAVYDNANTQFLKSLAASASASGVIGTFTSSDAIDLVDAIVAIRVGAVDPTAAQHLEIDPQSIQSKSNGTTPAALNINALGGDALIGNDGTTPDGSTVSLLYDGTVMLQTDAAGLLVSQDAVFSQQADHSFTPGAGIGALWHRTADGKIVWTDPAGVDFDLTTGAVAAGLTTQIQFNLAGVFSGDANLTWDGTDLVVVGGLQSTGINVTATTGERLALIDTAMVLGVAGSAFGVTHVVNDRNINYAGGVAGNGGQIQIYGASHAALPGDVLLRSSNQTFLNWDESVGDLSILTGIGVKTETVLFNPDQTTTFRAAVVIQGQITTTGIDDNTTGERLQLTDTLMQLGDNTAGEVFAISIRGVDTGILRLDGGTTGTQGANIALHGSTHGALPGDTLFNSGANTWMQWDESVGDLEILTGIGAKTSALTISSAQLATFTGAVTVLGAFTSLGIDDNATGERFELVDTQAAWGDAGAAEIWAHVLKTTNTGQHIFSGGSTIVNGGIMSCYGASHAALPGDVVFTSSNQTWMQWDESLGVYTVLTGTGSKTLALTISPAQLATFAGAVTVQGAFTSLGIDDNATANAITINASEVVDFVNTPTLNGIEFPATPEIKIKTADTDRNSTTVTSDDPHLVGWTLETDTLYKVEGLLQVNSSSAVPGFKCNLDFTNAPQADSSVSIVSFGSNNTGTGDSTDIIDGAVDIDMGAFIAHSVQFSAVFRSNATTGGTMDFQWAQKTSNGTDTRLNIRSYLEVTKLNL